MRRCISIPFPSIFRVTPCDPYISVTRSSSQCHGSSSPATRVAGASCAAVSPAGPCGGRLSAAALVPGAGAAAAISGDRQPRAAEEEVPGGEEAGGATRLCHGGTGQKTKEWGAIAAWMMFHKISRTMPQSPIIAYMHRPS